MFPTNLCFPNKSFWKDFFLKIIDEEKVLLILLVPSQESVLTNVHTHFQGSIKSLWNFHNSCGPQILVTFSRQEWNVGFPDISFCLQWTQRYILSKLFTFYILQYIFSELFTFYILDKAFNQVGAGLMVHPRLSAATAFYSLPLISKTQECCTSRCVSFPALSKTQVLCSVFNTFQNRSVVFGFQHFPKHKCCVLFSTQQPSSLTLYSLPGRVCNACY